MADNNATVATTSDENKITLVTKEGLQKLKEELDSLRNVRRKEVAERIKEAISYGDLSENSEYEEAKNEQGFVEGRIQEIEDKIKYAKVIEEKQHMATVQLGTRVTVRAVGRKKSSPEEYIIVGSTEADPLAHKISNESPVGAALLEKSKGDVVKVSAPSGILEYEILQLE
jgi:transcription elongation factor GreA